MIREKAQRKDTLLCFAFCPKYTQNLTIVYKTKKACKKKKMRTQQVEKPSATTLYIDLTL